MLEANLRRTDPCRECQEACIRTDSCVIWTFKTILSELEAQRRHGQTANAMRSLANGRGLQGRLRDLEVGISPSDVFDET